jgi:hypothetical protein
MSPITSVISGNPASAFGMYRSQNNPIKFISVFTESSIIQGVQISVDKFGNVITAAQTGLSDNTAFYSSIIKSNSSGNLLSQKRFGGNDRTCMTVDSNANIYVSYASSIIKINKDNVIQWTRTFTNFTSRTTIGIKYDSVNDFLYVVHGSGTGVDGTTHTITLVKYTSTGSIVWQRQLSGLIYWSDEEGSNRLTVSSSGDIYFAFGRMDSSGTPNSGPGYVVKYNSSGTLQWQTTIGSAYDGTAEPRGIAVDSSGNVFVSYVIYTTDAVWGVSLITKFNTSGTLQWQRQFRNSCFDSSFIGIDVDSTGNVYTCGWSGYDVINNYYKGGIYKFNTSGTLQFQRSLGGTTSNYFDQITGIFIDKSNFINVTGYVGNDAYTVEYGIVAKLPSDGTKTGTYSVIPGVLTTIYAALNDTNTAGTCTTAAGSLTESAGTLTDSTGSTTLTNDAVTYSVLTI